MLTVHVSLQTEIQALTSYLLSINSLLEETKGGKKKIQVFLKRKKGNEKRSVPANLNHIFIKIYK